MVDSERGQHSIRMPFCDYPSIVNEAQLFRAYIDDYYLQHPEVFPADFSLGYVLHDKRQSKKDKGLLIRRIKLKSGGVYSIIPSDRMPYLVGGVDFVAKGLLLRGYAVPYEVLALVLGKDSDYWERIEASLSRMSIVGSICKKGVPAHLAADEKITFINGQEAYVALTASQDCVLGAGFSLSEGTAGLEQAYGEFKKEALGVDAGYQPKSINLDGWKATQLAWDNLFKGISIILCFLHAFLKIREVSRKNKGQLYQLGALLWDAYKQPCVESFKQGLNRALHWGKENLDKQDKLWLKVKDIVDKQDRFATSYQHQGCYRTSNQIDRPMNRLDRYLYQTRYFHGHLATAQQKIRAWAMIYNFIPFTNRSKNIRKQHRFEELNGFTYHQNWLQNMLIAASMNGIRKNHKKH